MTAIKVQNASGVTITNVTAYGGTNNLWVVDSEHVVVRDFFAQSAGEDAVVLDGVTESDITVNVKTCDRHGFKVIDSGYNRLGGVIENAGVETNNTYDAVNLSGDSDFNRLAFTVRDNAGGGNRMRYGVNISASTCNTNIEASLLIGVGATGPYNDSGTDTRTTDDHIVS